MVTPLMSLENDFVFTKLHDNGQFRHSVKNLQTSYDFFIDNLEDNSR